MPVAERRTPAPALEVDRVCGSVVTWHRYASDVKAELFSTALTTNAGSYLVDPIAINPRCLRTALAPAPIAGVVVTNENHGRAAVEISALFSVPLYAHAATRAALDLAAAREVSDHEEFASGLTALAIDGGPAGEIAIYAQPEGGSLIIGDALINMGSYGFALLPAKYCSNQKQMRRSLRKLLDYNFERIVFAHGMPVVADANRRLADLLEAST